MSRSTAGVRRAIPAGLVDQGFASLATFVVGLFAVVVFTDDGAGAWALFFGAFRVATVISAWLIMIPGEVAALAYEDRPHRISLLPQTLRLGTIPSLLAAPIVALAAVLVVAIGSTTVSSHSLWVLTGTGIAAAFLSPLQDHVRRMLHLAGASWRAATVSVVQFGVIAVATAAFVVADFSDAWIPFGSLAIANAVSLPYGLVAARRMNAEPLAVRLRFFQLMASGRYLLTNELLFVSGDFAAMGMVYGLASPAAAAYAEAARAVARPLAVMSEGLRQVLAFRSMEAATDRSAESARRISRTFGGLVLLAGLGYLAIAGHDWALNPLGFVDKAYVIGGLAAVSILAVMAQGLMESPRAELIGGRRERALALIDFPANGVRLAVAATAVWIGGFAFPVSMIAIMAFRWLAYKRQRRDLYSSSAPKPVPGERPRILAFAYVAEPGRGSEHGAGWGMVQALGQFGDVTVLVGPDSIPGIRAWEQDHPNPHLEFVEVAEPGWLRLVPHEPHNKNRKHLWGLFIAYLGWQRAAAREGRRLHAATPFHVAYHATYSAYWLPSPAVQIGIPSVWGPVGGAVTAPRSMWRALGVRGMFWELFEMAAVWTFSLWPGTRATWRKATVPVLQNEETLRRLPQAAQRRAVLLNHVMFARVGEVHDLPREPFALFVSSFESRKGVHLALHGLAAADDDVRMVVVGDGPEKPQVEALVEQLGLSARVDLVGWRPYPEVQELFSTAGVVVFTGVREEGGFGLTEAMMRGAPVVVLANGGPRTIAAAAVDADRVAMIEPGSLERLAPQMGAAITRFVRSAGHNGSGPNLVTARAQQILEDAFAAALGVESVSPPAAPAADNELPPPAEAAAG